MSSDSPSYHASRILLQRMRLKPMGVRAGVLLQKFVTCIHVCIHATYCALAREAGFTPAWHGGTESLVGQRQTS